jgi:nucleolar protein 58
MGVRSSCHNLDFSDILPQEIESQLKEAAEVSMGTEIASEDVDNIKQLCDQVISISEYRASLYEYLRNRMNAIAPNLTVMVGELVGARLIAHAGSLMSLAKHPASTVQILGAEKALFRALKTKHDTPKYGLIYHASLVGQAAPKLKGKVSRMLAAKTALSIRMDALGDSDGVTIGYEAKEKVESRIKQLESGNITQISAKKTNKPQQEKYNKPNNT